MFSRAPKRQLHRLCAEVSQRHSESSFIALQRQCRRTFSFKGHPVATKDSIFSDTQSPWEHVFDNVPPPSQLLPSQLRTTLTRPRRQKMTAREINAFDDMFNMIFDAVAEHNIGDKDKKNTDINIGGGLEEIYGQLRRHSKRVKWTTEEDELLDKKKEEMNLCDTDQQLFDWAMREVFGESEKLEEQAQQAIESGSTVTTDMIQAPTYPHVLALLMSMFRDKYRDPHLALSIFDHARNLSIASYVFGCSTNVYNELIETRWSCFRDLKGVHDAIEEMTVNGVDLDNTTRSKIEKVRREIGERNVWVEEDEGGGDEVWSMMDKIERLAAPAPRSKQKRAQKWGDWKTQDEEDLGNDDWEFNSWQKPSSRPSW